MKKILAIIFLFISISGSAQWINNSESGLSIRTKLNTIPDSLLDNYNKRDTGSVLQSRARTTSQLTLKANAASPIFTGNVTMPSTTYFYLGDASTDGSWRFYVSSTALVFERRVSGTWTEKGRFEN